MRDQLSIRYLVMTSNDRGLTQEVLKSVLHYNEGTGIFTWINPASNRVKIGSQAGSLSSSGYLQIKINGSYYKSHRLAFLYMTGSIPEYVDHINRDREDNRWENLRAATRKGNARNRSTPKSNTSGVMGVSWDRQVSRWRASIGINGRKMFLGFFDSPEEAAPVLAFAREKYHGEFANCG